MTYDLKLLDNFSFSPDTVEIVQVLQAWCPQQTHLPGWLPDSIAQLVVPTKEAEPEAWRQFSRQLEQILLRYWRLEKFWEFSREEVDLLIQYLAATVVLVECLRVATLQDRAAIEAQLLLPPQ